MNYLWMMTYNQALIQTKNRKKNLASLLEVVYATFDKFINLFETSTKLIIVVEEDMMGKKIM